VKENFEKRGEPVQLGAIRIAKNSVGCFHSLNILPEETKMHRFVPLAVVATLSLGVLLPGAAQAGCYRLGETGYHWYRYCLGPSFIYPHHRICRHGRCWYR
jgi:hypothetical protein